MATTQTQSVKITATDLDRDLLAAIRRTAGQYYLSVGARWNRTGQTYTLSISRDDYQTGEETRIELDIAGTQANYSQSGREHSHLWCRADEPGRLLTSIANVARPGDELLAVVVLANTSENIAAAGFEMDAWHLEIHRTDRHGKRNLIAALAGGNVTYRTEDVNGYRGFYA